MSALRRHGDFVDSLPTMLMRIAASNAGLGAVGSQISGFAACAGFLPITSSCVLSERARSMLSNVSGESPFVASTNSGIGVGGRSSVPSASITDHDPAFARSFRIPERSPSFPKTQTLIDVRSLTGNRGYG